MRKARVKPKTEELLYLLLWSCDLLTRPTFRNLTDSFEGWAYRNGFHRQLARLEQQQMLESKAAEDQATGRGQRVLRLTEQGRLQALGGRDPESRWRRGWDGRWRVVLFDIPRSQSGARDRLRNYLRTRGFGHLQGSAWISPDPLDEEKAILGGGEVNVRSLILLEASPCAGETSEQIVTAAWDFVKINDRFRKHLDVLHARPTGPLGNSRAAEDFRKWACEERNAWTTAVTEDPLLPASLLPADYLGREAWQSRLTALREFSKQLRSYKGKLPNFHARA